MINSQSEALKFANHAQLKNYKYVVVFTDGSIQASNDKQKISALITESSFIVKGDLVKPVKINATNTLKDK